MENGRATIVADETTTVPQGGATFTAFVRADLLPEGVAFIAIDSAGERRLYRWRSGSLDSVVAPSDLGGTADFATLQQSGGDLYFVDKGSLYRFSPSGTLDRLLSSGDTLPNGSVVQSISGRVLEGSQDLVVARVSTNLGSALIARHSATDSLSVVVDEMTTLPGQTAPWADDSLFFPSFSVDGEQVAFVHMRQNFDLERTCQSGVYLWENGGFTQALSRADRHPETNVPFECFLAAYVGGGQLWFQGATVASFGGPTVLLPTQGELFATTNQGVLRVLTALDDRFTGSLFLYSTQLGDDRAFMNLCFGDHTRLDCSLYSVDFDSLVVGVPSLSWIGVLCFAGLLAAVATRSLRAS
ncbi:MAG: hypothetical protein AAF690_00350 [Acidobacteriota bacterium]